jgi:hypothetical protein
MKTQVLALAILVALTGCKSDPAPQPAPQPQPKPSSDWQFSYSKNVKLQKDGERRFFDFPSQDGAHYLTRKASTSNMLGKTVHVTFSLEGDGEVVPVPQANDQPPGTMSIMLQRKDDNMTDPDGRWWYSDKTELLAPGTFSLVVPVDPRTWSNVYGKPGTERKEQFDSVMRNIGSEGLTFGGASFAGHGAMVRNGKMRFILHSFEVR